MSQELPAWTRDSSALRLHNVVDLSVLRPEQAFGEGRGGGVRVAIIDSGIEADHPDLERSVDPAGGVDVVRDGDDARIVPGPHDDAFGHGTACASIVHQLAPEASITSVRVLGPLLGGRSTQFLAGLEWAIEEGFDVVNLSLGTKKREWALAFHDLCDRAYFAGTVVVTASNNVLTPTYPSVYASVVSVACNRTTDPERFHYNPNPPTEFLARGVDVDVAWRGGGRERVTGNSFAAPHITGIVARIRAQHPALRPFQVKSMLYALAANVTEADGFAGRVSRSLARLPDGRRTSTGNRSLPA